MLARHYRNACPASVGRRAPVAAARAVSATAQYCSAIARASISVACAVTATARTVTAAAQIKPLLLPLLSPTTPVRKACVAESSAYPPPARRLKQTVSGAVNNDSAIQPDQGKSSAEGMSRSSPGGPTAEDLDHIRPTGQGGSRGMGA